MFFDSRDERCKSPFGAAACGTQVTFCLRPDAGEAVTRCVLLTHREFADVWQETELPAANEDGRVVYRGVFTAPDKPDLIWYHFRLHWADGGECCFGKGGCQNWDSVTPWQLTVYDGARATPDWFGRGVTYQIFPDRFRRAETRGVDGMVGRRTLHAKWNEMMDYLPNAEGEITCSDFFGGDLAGITEKLGYLASLGVTTVYLNPIFESATNHRYDTADYCKVDPLLGGEEALRALCAEAEKHGIRIMLDGVFNHTGSNSVYFNADGFYPTLGAAQSKDSPYASWYHFSHFPDKYDAWWGFKTLPAVQENDPAYIDFIYGGTDSVVRRWLRAGISGWRLDVADELPDSFIAGIRRAMDEEKPGSYLIGEVWEDGSNKIAYSQRRRYLLGDETHSLMNYPFREAVLSYLRGGSASNFKDSMETIREHYPPAAFYGAMNFLATHDTPRPLTVLGYDGEWPQTRSTRGTHELDRHEYRRGKQLLKLAALVMYAFPGSPTIYYGDEAGMTGFEDPFNRGTYPWGHEDRDLVAYFTRLGAVRSASEPLQRGTIEYLTADGALLAFRRTADGHSAIAVCNAGPKSVVVELPWGAAVARDAISGSSFPSEDGTLRLTLPAFDGLLLVEWGKCFT